MTCTVIDLRRYAPKGNACEDSALYNQMIQSCGIALIIIAQEANNSILNVIEDMLKQPFVQQVIVVDNDNLHSIKEALRAIETTNSRVQVIVKKRVQPQGYVLNQAIARVRQPYVLIADQQYKLSSNAIWKLLVAAQMLSGLWLLGVQRQDITGKEYDSITNLSDPFVTMRQMLGAQTVSTTMRISRSNGLMPYHVPAANAACIFMPLKVCDLLKGWQERTTIVGGYWDFCMRLHAAQGHVYYLPEVSMTAITDKPLHWMYQWYTAQGFIAYFAQYNQHASRLVRWPVRIAITIGCLLVVYVRALRQWIQFFVKKS